jgi:hypothetical protein
MAAFLDQGNIDACGENASFFLGPDQTANSISLFSARDNDGDVYAEEPSSPVTRCCRRIFARLAVVRIHTASASGLTLG